MVFLTVVCGAFTEETMHFSSGKYTIKVDRHLYLTGEFHPDKMFPIFKKLYELEGKITVALSRYLHTYADLVLRRPRLPLEQSVTNLETSTSLQNASADSYILNNHSLKEHRRMRSKTLHYLDSPEFALLILITPYEPADEVSTTLVQ